MESVNKNCPPDSNRLQPDKFNIPDRMEITHSGYQFPFYVRNNTSDTIVYKAIIEDEKYDFTTLEEPKIIIDAGGNIGLAAVFFAKKYPNATIISIEPEESNFKLLKENTKNYNNIIALQYALWNSMGEIDLLDVGLDNWGFMTEDSHNYDKITTPKIQKKHTVKTITMERLISEYNIQTIDILKIDIEGAEKEVLEDISGWINKVRSIIIELHERMKIGCQKSFEKAIYEFDEIARSGADIYLSKGGFIQELLQ